MEVQESKAAVIGIYVAGVLGALCSIGAWLIRSYPQVPTWVETTLWVSGLVLLLVAVSLYSYVERQHLRTTLSSRQAQHASNTAALVAVLGGILVMVNFMASHHHQRFDLTQHKQYSLSEQTFKVLGKLDNDVNVTSYYAQNNQTGQQIKDLLTEYQYASPHFKFEAVDPERNPARARAANITRETVIMESQGRRQELSGFTEQDFTGGLLKLLRPKAKVIYFLQGHGEQDPEETGQNGMSIAKGVLTKQNYEVQKLALVTKPEVPNDASMLIIAGPAKPVLPAEQQAIARFIEGGGRVLIMLNPRLKSGLEGLAQRYGVSPDDDLVIDLKSHFFIDAGTPMIVTYKYHDITHSLQAASYFPGARSFTIADKSPAGVTASQLALTTDRSYGLSDTNTKGQITAAELTTAKKGPLAIAVAVDYTPPASKATPPPGPYGAASPPARTAKAHLVLFGNSTFASNGLFNNLANGDFFLNSVNWLAEEAELISIPAKPPDQHRLDMSNNQLQFVYIFSIFLLPLGMLAIGGAIWWRRR